MKKGFAFGLFFLFFFCCFGQKLSVEKEVDSLIQTNRANVAKRQFEQAFESIDLADSLAQKHLDETHFLYAKCLYNYGRTFHFINMDSAALAYYRKAKRVWESQDTILHPDFAVLVDNMALLENNMANYEAAIALFELSLEIREKFYGRESTQYVRSMAGLSKVYSLIDQPDKAIVLNIEGMQILEKLNQKNSESYSQCLLNLANLKNEIGAHNEALSHQEEALKIIEKILGKNTQQYAGTLADMGSTYLFLYDFENAERCYLVAIGIESQRLGVKHDGYAVLINNLAALYSRLGLYEKAIPLAQEVVSIWENTLGKQHPLYAGGLMNLALLHESLNRFKEAETLMLQALDIYEKYQKGNRQLIYIPIIHNLGNLYKKKKEYDKAERYLLQSKELFEQYEGKNSANYIGSIFSLALLKLISNDFVEAETLFEQALKLQEKNFGKDNPDYFLYLKNFASLFILDTRCAEAAPLFMELANSEKRQILNNANFLNINELVENIASFKTSQNQFFSHLRDCQQVPPEQFRMGWDNQLFFKGFLQEKVQSLSNLGETASAETLKPFLAWKSLNKTLATELALPIAEREDLNGLQARADSLEKILVRSVAGFAEARKQVNWQEVQNALSPGEAAVEFVRFDYFNPDPTDSVLYAALILRPGDEAPTFIPLFEKQEIAPLLQNAKGGNYLKINQLYAPQQAANGQKSLGDLIWNPLEPFLKDVKTVYCSPAGLLHRLNLGAIRVADGSAFSDKHKLILLGSTRQLVSNFSPGKIAANDAYLAGGIRYAMDSVEISKANLSRSRGLADADELAFQPDSNLRGDKWGFLPESSREVLEINQLLKKSGFEVQADTGFLATEEAFRNLGVEKPSPKIVHLSTHGFFFPEPKTVNHLPSTPDRQPVFKMSEHPMIRTGLVMAGGNATWSGQKPPQGMEDGILTAYEISQMNLSNTELVVLSACETGLGDIEGNEGVYGLQRAFKIAGAKYLIMSLWKVNDQTTRELMTEFYRQWLDNQQAIPDAFRAAQARLRAKYPDAPFHWAGFLLLE